MQSKMIYWLKELKQEDLYLVGKKCANLGEMTNHQLPVPPGFAISLEAYRKFIFETGLQEEISKILNEAYYSKHPIDDLELLSKKIRSMMESATMPDDIKQEIIKFYHELSKKMGKKHLKVAVRSSGPVSMPGSYETFLYVHGDDDVINKVIKCWSSTFNARSLATKIKNKVSIEDAPIGVAVIKMVNAKAAGVLFTINPITGDRSKMLVEANWGLGESIVSGRVGPDRFRLNRFTSAVEERTLGSKEEECVYDAELGEVVFKPIPEERKKMFCLTDEELDQLVRLGKKVEAYFGNVPQDIEWAFDRDMEFGKNLLLLQARPEQTYAAREKQREKVSCASSMDYISDFLSKGVKLKV
ncbi:PEP/pyruvate-binding domain-containing protein [Desulfallas sp. Bu1-1]|uniref:PEP/pyruvate-binding domain-containing protein n=1 Tax=Desulfallas sp. Bu1-1 TaxID=2787620 RepID=UPI00189D5C94|nr:PEP/pyruvate-binding domain-containing protein [Desulfallas sp. Bu1-1]MBF7084448.1 PEP/pyruvate-binding domain-containing protein [Desulfallas sp. Bu1-1]